MSARRNATPAGDIKDGWNVHEFPTGEPAIRLNRNQRIRAGFMSMNWGYQSFYDSAEELWKEDATVRAALCRVDRGLDMLWWALLDAGVIRRD